ncbi:TlpA disulfide reductase family protein [Sphingobium boeckii]|uniref:Thiol-disulfide isomerase/thioredoxin n=1 Tax=Sphingobium boeckii TaxID=1082345 RepID=A0A7W9EG15_9SPHN|nr:thiol-disulfide isomerase/thioredoxin [Sphingobium boeckii]
MRSEILLLLGALALAGCDRQSEQAPQPAENVAAPVKVEDTGKLDIENRGKAMPDAVFQDPDGEKISLGDFKGKPVLVNLWATWCVPCVKEMPTLDALAAREKDRLVVLAVSQDGNGKAVVDPWFAKNSLKMIEAYIDPEQALGDHFQTGMLPTTILYDAQGKEVWRVIGGMDWDGPRANTLLAETLGT